MNIITSKSTSTLALIRLRFTIPIVLKSGGVSDISERAYTKACHKARGWLSDR